ncbi:uncharacterized protein LOC141771411 isoform X2 [Sebastes fasciatus]
MEAEQEGEKEMKMVLRCPPIYPLPEEIKQMERSETVCRYCGVSYLIFHEFHQLNTRLAQLEEELQGLRETTQREKAQREALELGRLEWERAFHLEVQRQTEENEKSTREELEERNKDTKRALREEFEQKNEKTRREMKDEYQKICEEKERRLRRELGDLEEETLRKQREELERRSEEREKVLSDALQKANKNLDELRKYFQQLEERLAVAATTKEEAEQLLGKEKLQGEILRGVCVRQQQALRATLPVLRSTARELTGVRGFLSQLMGVWQAFRSQILQHSTQVFSGSRGIRVRSSCPNRNTLRMSNYSGKLSYPLSCSSALLLNRVINPHPFPSPTFPQSLYSSHSLSSKSILFLCFISLLHLLPPRESEVGILVSAEICSWVS